MILDAERGGAVDGRRAGLQVRGAGGAAGARAGDRGAGGAQPAGEEGRAAVPHRPDASTRTSSTPPRPSWPPTRPSSRRPVPAWSMHRPARGSCRSSSSPPAGRCARCSRGWIWPRLRVRQNRELVATGAGDRFALEQAESNVTELEGPDRHGHGERSAGDAEAVGAGQRRAGHRWRRRAPNSPPPRRRSTPAVPTWRTRSGISTRRRSTRRPTATRSTCSCARAPS